MGGFLSGRTSLTTVLTADIADDAITEAKMATDAIGITELKAGTDGNIISYDASGDPVAIATGNDGQVLTSAGAGAQPAFEDAAGGSWSIIGTAAASDSASLTITGLSSTYEQYAVGLSGFRPASDGQEINMRLGDSGGIDSGSTDYFWVTQRRYNSGGAGSATVYEANVLDAEDSVMKLQADDTQGNAVGEGMGGMFWLTAPHSSNTHPMIHGAIWSTSGATLPDPQYVAGTRRAVIDVTQVQVFYSSGNITSGRFTVWGIAHV